MSSSDLTATETQAPERAAAKGSSNGTAVKNGHVREKARANGKKDRKPKKGTKKKPKLTASTADRHDLYQQSVQCPEADIKFFDRVYKKTYGERPSLLREDFCGTALLSCEWVKRRPGNRAIGVDLDPEVLGWGRRHNLEALGDRRELVTLFEEDVLTVETEPVQVVASMNFSYFIFTDRPTMVRYYRSVRASLQEKGLFVLDLMGGPEAQVIQEEEKDVDGFTYVWDQDVFNPITHHCTNYIHFRFKDGTEMNKAFTYEWRLWSVPEIRDMLHEAGFRGVDVYWEGSDEDGEGNGVFRKSLKGDDSPAWIAYIVATP